MKKVSFLITFCIVLFSYAQNRQDYHLSWDGTSSILKVKLLYTPTNKDSTVFVYGDPTFGGQIDIFKVVKNIHCNPSENLKISENDRKITVYHHDSKTKTLTYEIDGSKPDDKKSTIYTELFRPVITSGFLSTPNSFFMLDKKSETNDLISIVWDHYPHQYTYFNSMNPTAAANKNLSIKEKEMGRYLFVMGNKISVKKYNVMGIPYYSIYSNEKEYSILKTKLPPYFTDYFPSIRKFWNDTDEAFYYVAVLPLKYAGKTKAGGYGMDDGFLMKYLGDYGYWEKHVIAHETSHHWIGLKLIIGKNSFDNQWFGEGFNDYVTLINLAKSKIDSKEEFINYLNKENLELHYKSPVKDSSNASIAKNYWTDYPNYGKLPYRRGLIYAFYLDNQIRLASKGKFTLRNLLIDLKNLEHTKKESIGISLEEFINLGSKYIPKEQFENEIKTYMIAGKPIDFKTVKLIPEFQLYFEKDIPQIKFTPNASIDKIYNW